MQAGWGDSLSPAAVFHGFDFSLTRTVQLDINPFQYRRQINGDLRIPESNDTVSFLFQPKLSCAIPLRSFVVIMMSAIEFNDEMLGRAKEINDIRTNRRLAPEVGAVYGQLF
jgi:hypothetical protein